MRCKTSKLKSERRVAKYKLTKRHNDPAQNRRGNYELINGKYFETSSFGNQSPVRIPVDALVMYPKLLFKGHFF